MIKVSIHQDDITILHIYALDDRVSKHISKKVVELQGGIE